MDVNSNYQELDWSTIPTPSPTIDFYETFRASLVPCLEQWCMQTTAESKTAELDEKIKVLDWVITRLGSSGDSLVIRNVSGAVNDDIGKIVIESLLKFDQVLMDKRCQHFKLMAMIWKGLFKLCSTRKLDPSLRSDAVLSFCSTRALNSFGRTVEEERKIRTFLILQLTKFVGEKLPNRHLAMATVLRTAANLDDVDQGIADACIGQLAQDDEQQLQTCLADIVDVFQSRPRLFQLFLSSVKNPKQLTVSCMPLLTRSFDIPINHLSAFVGKELEGVKAEIATKAAIQEFCGSQNAMESAFFSLVFQQNRNKLASSDWARASLQGLVACLARGWAAKGALSGSDDPEFLKMKLLAALSWKIDCVGTLQVISSHGKFSHPALTLLDCARIQLIKCCPNPAWLRPIQPLIKDLSHGTSQQEMMRLKRFGKAQVILLKLESFCILGKAGSQNSDYIPAILSVFDSAPNQSLEALAWNSKSLTSTPLLLNAFEVIRSHQGRDILNGMGRFLKSLRSAPCLQQTNSRDNDKLAQEIVEAFTAYTRFGGEGMLCHEDALSSMADLMSSIPIELGARIKAILPADYEQGLIHFLRNNRQSRVPLVRSSCGFPSQENGAEMTALLSGKPPFPSSFNSAPSPTSSTEAADCEDENVVENTIRKLKQACSKIRDVEQLDQMERAIVESLRLERKRLSPSSGATIAKS